MIFYDLKQMNPKKKRRENLVETYFTRNLNLIWKNVIYSVSVRRQRSYMMDFLCGKEMERVEILHDISGAVKSGTLLAILGSSGAGKTTLLAAISKRIKHQVTGSILVNGKPIDRDLMSKISGFVPQDEFAMKSLTVREHMEFMAKMKMDRRLRRIVRLQKMNTLLSDLGLSKLYDSKLSTLSNGEWKRVSLAVQLLTDPKILFCDEPTTGLDSYSATVVIETLKNIVATGRIVICSLHQPASGILEQFHQIILLAMGKVAFQGSVDDAITFFNGLGFHCSPTFNYAEFFVSQLSTINGDPEKCRKKIQFICEQFEKSIYYEKVTAIIDECLSENNNLYFNELIEETNFKKVRPLAQLEWLTWRNFIDYRRNKNIIFYKFFIYTIGGVILSLPYLNVTQNIDQLSIQNIQGLMYYVVTETIFTYHYAVFYTFPRELPLLLRDMANGLYYPAPYYVSKILIMIPGAIIESLIYATLVFYLTGLRGGILGLIFFIIPVIFGAISAAALGCFFSAAFTSFDTASLISVCIDFITLIFSGIYLNLSTAPPRVSWIKYISQFYYCTEAISLMQWTQYDHIDCLPNPEISCITSGDKVLEYYGFSSDNYYIDLLGLTGIFIFGHCVGYIAIRCRSKKEPIY